MPVSVDSGARRGLRHRLLVEAPEETSLSGFIKLRQLIEQVLGRQIDLVEYGGLQPRLDDHVRREAVLV